MGFPTRSGRAAFGPTYEDEKPVTDPQRELGANVVNLDYWQVAGLSQVTPRIVIKGTISAGVVTNAAQMMAFDPDSGISAISFTYESAGHYSFAFASQYPDQGAVNRNLSLIGGSVSAINGMAGSGTHTGAANQAMLTDSAASYTVNEHAGKYIYNTTDGSYGIVISNTADTVTATLGGGTDNDWDTSDAYIILAAGLIGHVNLTSSYAGDIYFLDTGKLAETDEFLLLLW